MRLKASLGAHGLGAPEPPGEAARGLSRKWGDVPGTARKDRRLKVKVERGLRQPLRPFQARWAARPGSPRAVTRRRAWPSASSGLVSTLGAAEPPDPATAASPSPPPPPGRRAQLPDPQPPPPPRHAPLRGAAGLAMPAPSRDAGRETGRAGTGGAGGGSAGRGESSPERHGCPARPAVPRPRPAAPPARLRGPAPFRLG